MNKKDRGVLVGMVLGDAFLNVISRLKNGKYPYIRSEIAICHSIKQEEYCIYKSELLRTLFGGVHQVRYYNHYLPVTGKSYRQCRFTKSNKYFRILKSAMYPNGKKTISRKILEWLTPHGIAIWYMDDGSMRANKKNGNVTSVYTEISTQVSEEEAIYIREYFKKRWSLNVKPFQSKNYWDVRFNTQESKKLVKIIKPYIIPSMRYKISLVADLLEHECQTPEKAMI
jgi:hypothetical protein